MHLRTPFLREAFGIDEVSTSTGGTFQALVTRELMFEASDTLSTGLHELQRKVLSFNSKVVEPLNRSARMVGAELDDISRNIVFGWVLINLS